MTDVNALLADASTNELTASSAPQQQVVNGWAAKDLLAAIALDQQAANKAQVAANEQWKLFAWNQLATAEQTRKTGMVLSTLLVVLIALSGLSVFARSLDKSGRTAPADPISPKSDPVPLVDAADPGPFGNHAAPAGGVAGAWSPDGQPTVP